MYYMLFYFVFVMLYYICLGVYRSMLASVRVEWTYIAGSVWQRQSSIHHHPAACSSIDLSHSRSRDSFATRAQIIYAAHMWRWVVVCSVWLLCAYVTRTGRLVWRVCVSKDAFAVYTKLLACSVRASQRRALSLLYTWLGNQPRNGEIFNAHTHT